LTFAFGAAAVLARAIAGATAVLAWSADGTAPTLAPK
jgi:hypothetical protein